MISHRAFAVGDLGDVDHAGIIRAWNDESRARGERIFASSCAACHGTDGNTTNLPTARAFGRDAFKYGSDPYSMWRTLTYGSGMMLPQTWLSPSERYDVIQYVRETLVKPTNPGQYVAVSEALLASYPKGTQKGGTGGSAPRDYGPALSSQLERRVASALTVFLDDDTNLTYDTHRIMLSDAWHGTLNLEQTEHQRLRGEGQPRPEGAPLANLRTWYWPLGDALDPPPANHGNRGIEGNIPMGPLPADVLRYRGRYLYGNSVALAYDVQGRGVLEMPGVTRQDQGTILHHTMRIAPGENSLVLCVGKFEGDGWPLNGIYPLQGGDSYAPGADARLFLASAGAEADGEVLGTFLAAGVSGAADGVAWITDEQQRIGLRIPASDIPRTLRVHLFSGDGEGSLGAFASYLRNEIAKGELGLPDMAALERGGLPRWRQEVAARGIRDATRMHYRPSDYKMKDRRLASGAHVPYAVDTMPLPTPNPWNAWLRPTAMDCFPDGRLALATYGGDVWILSGVDESLENLRWRRFAAGLFEPMGLKIIDGVVYVTCRDGILKLQDLNGDGEADFYETFFADPSVSTGFHAFNFGLERDSGGNLYYVKPGRYTDYPLPGALIRVSPDGTRHEEVCTGFRVPNGTGIAAGDTLYVTDNQGNWIPANKINRIVQGAFYGLFQTDIEQRDSFEPPILWMPQEYDNSPGSVIQVDDARFGPLNGRLMHPSFGKGWIYCDFDNTTDGVPQGATFALPFQFDAGVMRACVNPADGQVYTAGLTGWDTEATTAEGCLHRIRYTGAAGCVVVAARAEDKRLDLTFSSPLEEKTVATLSNYQVEQWNYRRTKNYGSDHWSVVDPTKQGHDILSVAAAKLSDNGTSLSLYLPELRAAQTTRLELAITAAAGFTVEETVYFTVN